MIVVPSDCCARSFLEQRLHSLSPEPQPKKIFAIEDVIMKLLQSEIIREGSFNIPQLKLPKEAVLPHLGGSE